MKKMLIATLLAAIWGNVNATQEDADDYMMLVERDNFISCVALWIHEHGKNYVPYDDVEDMCNRHSDIVMITSSTRALVEGNIQQEDWDRLLQLFIGTTYTAEQ